MRNKTADPISLEATIGLAKDVLIRGVNPYARLLNRIERATPGTRHYRDLLCQLSVASHVLEVKAREQQLVIDEYLDSLPDD